MPTFKFTIDAGKDNEVIPCNNPNCPCPQGREHPHIFKLKSEEAEAETYDEAYWIVDARLPAGSKIFGVRPEKPLDTGKDL